MTDMHEDEHTEEEHFALLRNMQRQQDEREAKRLVELAAAMGVELVWLDPDITPGVNFSYVAPNGAEIQIVQMIFNWRICEAPDFWTYDRSWCYGGRGDATFRTALLALLIWQGDSDTYPPGYLKATVSDPRHNCAGWTVERMLALLPPERRPDLDRFTIGQMNHTLRQSEVLTADPFKRQRIRQEHAS